ncbi:SRPBCC family protein [Lysobacter sp. BMK333-48F3]|uniref:SRPBCC family protein n=1 Tax=Lysobacter sp. BMK333-48F3 TaxID=2867962 RepID=UPI001C8BF826|nr:SRPBCC family protein [Lysobacter sp. BMK333-48F3]MBX9402350.1 SRPBCC family protein [Lysobacter sp. BMK333-48F3]
MTRLIEILISLAIVAVLFLVVGVVLPSSRHLSHSVETNRKLTIVFDTLNSMRRFKDWNPLVLRDPNMEVKLVGKDEGVGARLEYSSKERGLGKGSWEIVKSEAGKLVGFKISNPEPGENKRTQFSLRPTGKNNRNVEITQTYDVDYGWNLLGRYSGLYVSSNVGEDMKMGLARLSNLLATVPNYDYAKLSETDPNNAPKIVDRPAENVLTVTAAVERNNDKIKAQIQGNMEWIKKVIAANGLEAVGPVRIVTNEFGTETYSFDVAQVVRKIGDTSPEAAKLDVKVDGAGNPVKAEYWPATKVVVATSGGHNIAGLPPVRDAVRAWALTRGYTTTERPYEAWKAGIDASFDPALGQFDVYWPVK